MSIDKYNLFINKSFNTYDFSNNKDISIYSTVNNNFLENTVYIIHSNKPSSSSTFLTINVNDIIEVYLFPTMNTNITFKINELLHTIDNNAIFIITNHIEENKFAIKLIQCDNDTDYNLYNNFPSLLYNKNIEDLYYSLNSNKDDLADQKSNYTSILNSGTNLSDFINSNILISTDYTNSYTLNFNFSSTGDFTQIASVIDKFYLNLQIYDYNDFKYIYYKDIIKSSENYALSSTNYITGILKSSYTKILPHKHFKLQLGTDYVQNDTILNKYTSYSTNYSGQKIILLFQLSINDKSVSYDISNNIESDSIYVIT